MSKEKRQHGKIWNSLVARSQAYADAADRLVELGEYNRHIDQEMCALLKKLGGSVTLTEAELDEVKDMSFNVIIQEDDNGKIVCKSLDLK